VQPDASQFDAADVIERCYRQIFFHAMASDRDLYLESQFRIGSITTRDFVRGLLLSDRFYRGYVACNTNERLVEQVVGRVLGRPVFGVDEKLAWSVVIGEKGFQGFVDTILDGPEYMSRFGYDSVPEQVNRVLPGRPVGELPIYQRLPRYADDWRDRLIVDGMMMSVEAFNQVNNAFTVSQFLYEKPEGKALKIWLAILILGSAASVVTILSIFGAMFQVR
jgi:phycobilisome rod-core linker protein